MQAMRSELNALQAEISALDTALAAPTKSRSMSPAADGRAANGSRQDREGSADCKVEERAQRAKLQELLRQKRSLCARLDKSREEVGPCCPLLAPAHVARTAPQEALHRDTSLERVQAAS